MKSLQNKKIIIGLIIFIGVILIGGYGLFRYFNKNTTSNEVNHIKTFTKSSTISDVMNNASFVGFGNLIFPVDRPIDGDTRLDDIDDIYIWYNYIDDDTTVDIVNSLKEDADSGNQVFYPIYTEEEMRQNPEKRKITISFDLEERMEKEERKRFLQINIVENVNGQERIFGISDRSKGFIWYYNFIMKIQFNPKQNINCNTVFLLDEPGSYLHETAQNELCKKLVEIFKDEGVVIYCTHSPQLLNPSYIPLSTINIVSKTRSKVSCVPISSYKTRSTQTTAFQPIYEALQIPEFKMIDNDKKIVAGEGIYDKYIIEMFCDLPEGVITFGSANAKSLRDNIQYFIAFSIKYMAIWDNDPEGNGHYKNAKSDFGDVESKNFFTLPNLHNKPKVRMEEMFENEDMNLINDTIGLPHTSSYTLTMSNLYYSEDREKKLLTIKSNLSQKCINSFANLSATIKNHFNL